MSEDNSEHEITITPKRKQVIDDYQSGSNNIDYYATPSLDDIFAEGEYNKPDEQLKSILNELPDQRIPEVNQVQNFAIRQKLIKKIMTDCKDAAQQAALKIMANHPEAEGLGFKFSGRVYSQKFKGLNLSKAFIHMLDCLVYRFDGCTTQKAILESVRKSTGISELNANIWTMPLKNFVKEKLKDRLNSHGLQVALANCSSMSDLRKAIETHLAKRTAINKIKVDITITPNLVIVNGTTHKVTTITSGAYEYKKIRLLVNGKRTWLNVDELKSLFGLVV